MKLVGCSDQGAMHLDTFYSEARDGADKTWQTGGAAMLSLIERLRALDDDRQVWGLTSHFKLCLLAADAYQSPWFVRFVALDRHNYFIEYLMPEHLAPWHAAYVTGEARSEDEAVAMILKAMERSEGWRATNVPTGKGHGSGG